MGMTDHGEHLRVVTHELVGHALTARSLGYQIATILTKPAAGGWSGGSVFHEPRADRTGLEGSIDTITILMAGEIAETMLVDQLPAGYWQPVDDDEAMTAEGLGAALRLMDDQITAEVVRSLVVSSARQATDLEAAQREAEVAAGEEHDLLLALCSARARRIVAGNIALGVALIPEILPRPLVTGDELEAFIAALKGAPHA